MLMDRFCVVCILNQVIRVASHLDCEQSLSDKIFAEALKVSAELDFRQFTSPEFAREVYNKIAGVTAVPDPYKNLRKEQNDLILAKIDHLREKINRADDPLYAAALFSLAGNIIDYGGVNLFDTKNVFREMNGSELTINDFSKFREKAAKCERMTIIADNAGEAVFDKLFLEQIKKFNPKVNIFYAVKSGPAINDVLKEDAQYIGIDKIAEIIETGADFAGTKIVSSTDRFRRIYYESDIVISKGQGNFETLESEPEDLLFIFKVKCQVVARFLNLDTGSLIFAFKNSLL